MLLVVQLPMTLALDLNEEIPRVVNDKHSLSSVYPDSRPQDSVGLIYDDFSNAPEGYDESIWNLDLLNASSVGWEEDELLVLDVSSYRHTALVSELTAGPNVIVIPEYAPIAIPALGLVAEFDLSFSQGDCYFGVGWSDIDTSESAVSFNLRFSQYGVFLDYYDGRLYLCSYNDGQRSITPVQSQSLDTMNSYRLVWTDSLVYVEVDGVVSSCLTTNIPTVILPFMLAVSGAHYRCGADRLVVDTVDIYTHGTPSYFLGPEVLLVWPQNKSTVQPSDVVRFNLYGSDEYLTYTWDDGPSTAIEWPWQVPVPTTPGVHNLEVLVWNYTGGWITKDFTFTIQTTGPTLQGQELVNPPILDGTIETWESEMAYDNPVTLLREDGMIHPIDVAIGFWNDSLYLGVYTNAIAGLTTRLDLLIDADADGEWFTEQSSTKPDFRLSMGSPEYETDENGIWFSDGTRASRERYENIILESATQNSFLMIEFLIPLNNVTTDGLSFGISLSHGGMISHLVTDSDDDQGSTMVEIEYTNQPVNYTTLYLYLIPIGAVILVAVSIVVLRRPKVRVSPHLTLEDEHVERLRTLILSYPRISLNRLRTMTGFDSKTFDRSLEILVDKGLVDIQILPTGEIIRNHHRETNGALR